MTGRQSHRPAERTSDGRTGPMEASGPFPPAQTLQRPAAAAVTSTGSVTAAAHKQVEWIIDHAQADLRNRGAKIPDEIADLVRDLLNPLADDGKTDNPAETIEEEIQPFLIAGEVAEQTGINPRTLRHLADEGLVRSRKAGPRARLYDLASVQEYLRRK